MEPRRILPILWVLMTLQFTELVRAQEEWPCISAVKLRMEQFVADQEIAGAITVVASPEDIIHFDISGWADYAKRDSLQKDSLFCIASMTKPITATAIMILQEEGQLSLEDPVTQYLPEFQEQELSDGSTAQLTIQHLLTHTSGMQEIPREELADVSTLAQLIPRYAQNRLRFEPGSRWAYSQASLNTAARIVEVVSGQSFPEFLDERLFGPLGMKDTTFYPTERQVARLAKAYKKTEAGLLEEGALGMLQGKSPTDRNRYPKASGGLFSTATDYTQFCQMILRRGELDGRRYLSPHAVEQMTTLNTGNLKAGFTSGTGWGIGWCVIRKPQGVAAPLSAGSFGHGGAYGTQAWIDPVTERIYVLMVQRLNFANSDKSIVRKEFLRLATD